MTTKETAQKAIAKAINGDKNHGWGIDDSLAVIIALLREETGEMYGDKDKDGVVIGADLLASIKQVINPSQFRQRLESAKLLNEQPKRAAKVESLLADFKA
jgi:hypothetical protein